MKIDVVGGERAIFPFLDTKSGLFVAEHRSSNHESDDVKRARRRAKVEDTWAFSIEQLLVRCQREVCDTGFTNILVNIIHQFLLSNCHPILADGKELMTRKEL